MKLLREPLLHFLLIGAAIYLLYGALAEPLAEADDKTIVVSAAEIEWMKSSWQARWNRPPTPDEFDGLIQQYIREMVLYREALTMGLNQHDMVIRRRLAQKLEFLAKDLVALTPPTDEELVAYFDANQDRYREPVLYTFTQVFIDPDKRGDATLTDAEAIKATLIARGDDIADAGALGDDLMLQSYFPEKEPLEIQKSFGRGFTASLMDLAPGRWHGPVLSGYGTHLVYLSDVREPLPPVFDAVRDQVVADWTADRSEELSERFYANLRDSYTIVIEEPVIERPASDEEAAVASGPSQ
jgi:peptidyl-prolyl cis-trans isomerase C